MTFLKELQVHKGGLLRLTGELFWYGGRGWDGSPGQICLVLDAKRSGTLCIPAAAATTAVARVTAERGPAALLLIDGAPHWVWVARADVEIL